MSRFNKFCLLFNRFCLFIKQQYQVLNKQYQAGWNNQNLMETMHVFWILFHVLKVLLTKLTRYNYHSFYFLLFYISFCISRYHFLQIFRILFSLTWKIFLSIIFLCFNRFSLTLFNSQNLLSETKVFCQSFF